MLSVFTCSWMMLTTLRAIIHAPCHIYLVFSRMSIAPRASRTLLISTHASYRLARERGETRGAGGSAGAGASWSTETRRRAAGVPGSQTQHV